MSKTGSASKTGTVSKTGSATKTGTVTLVGNSVADTVIGGQVSADVQGWQDDGSGTYTGTPNALIERPDHISKHILGHRCGLTLNDVIDSTTYTAAGAYYNTESFVLAFAILERPNARELLKEVAYYAKSIQFWEAGVHFLIHIPDTITTDKSIDANRVDLGQIWEKFTLRAQIKNTLTGTYERDWAGYNNEIEADRSIVTATDALSIAKFGTLTGDGFSLPYIPGSTQAQAVLDWIKEDLAAPRLLVEFVGGYYLTDLMRGDIINFTHVETVAEVEAVKLLLEDGGLFLLEDGTSALDESTGPGEETPLYDALLELVTFDSDQFRIIDMARRPDAAIQIQAVKTWMPVLKFDNFDPNGTFTPGNTITGAESGHTATIRRVVMLTTTTGTLELSDATGKFQDNEIIYESALGSELVTNGDMELDSNWEDHSDPVTNERSSTRKHSGTYSRHIETDGTWGGAVQDTLTFTLGSFYLFDAWVYIESGDCLMSIGVDVWDGKTTSTTGEWVNVSEIFQSGASGDTKSLFIQSDKVSEFYADDVSVKQITNAALANGTL